MGLAKKARTVATGGLIIAILCGLTAALLVLTMGAGWLLAGAAYAVFGSIGLVLALMTASGTPED